MKKRNKKVKYFLVEACDSQVIKVANTIKELKKGIAAKDWEYDIIDQVFEGEVDSKGRFVISPKTLLHATNVFELFDMYKEEGTNNG